MAKRIFPTEGWKPPRGRQPAVVRVPLQRKRTLSVRGERSRLTEDSSTSRDLKVRECANAWKSQASEFPP